MMKCVLIISFNNYFHGKLSVKEKQTIEWLMERDPNSHIHFIAVGLCWLHRLLRDHDLGSGLVWFILWYSKHSQTHDYFRSRARPNARLHFWCVCHHCFQLARKHDKLVLRESRAHGDSLLFGLQVWRLYSRLLLSQKSSGWRQTSWQSRCKKTC